MKLSVCFMQSGDWDKYLIHEKGVVFLEINIVDKKVYNVSFFRNDGNLIYIVDKKNGENLWIIVEDESGFKKPKLVGFVT